LIPLKLNEADADTVGKMKKIIVRDPRQPLSQSCDYSKRSKIHNATGRVASWFIFTPKPPNILEGIGM
jgi:hypothetical protein